MAYLARMTTTATVPTFTDRQEAMRALEQAAEESRRGEWTLEVVDADTGERWTRSHASGWVCR